MERLTSPKEAATTQKDIDREIKSVGYSKSLIPTQRYVKLSAYEDTGLTPEEITALQAERDALVKRCGGTIPVHCSDCELWGKSGWSQNGIGYCEGDDKSHKATDFCSYGKLKEDTDNAK